MAKISSLDAGYTSGDLSVFPNAIDDKTTLYQARNNAETVLKHSLTYNAKIIIVEDATAFPPNGLIRIGPKSGDPGNAELVYYGSRSDTIFSDLSRGFAGSIRTQWPGGTTFVTNAVMAEHHNAVKDAIIQIERKLGLKSFPADGTLNKKLSDLENRFLAPRPMFRAFPLRGKPSLTVNFKPFCDGDIIRYLWDFGDGTTSIEKSPTHIYQSEGVYTVKFNIITSTGAQGISVKNNYITVSEDEIVSFFYAKPQSTTTAPATFDFVDQTDGNIIQRYWVFDDGTTQAQTDPDKHTTTHTYTEPGTYSPTLLLVFDNQRIRRVFLQDPIVVI
jgi:PKD repeat protein